MLMQPPVCARRHTAGRCKELFHHTSTMRNRNRRIQRQLTGLSRLCVPEQNLEQYASIYYI